MRPIVTLLAALAPVLMTAPVTAQTQPRGPEAFESENAILDTALPFAIGAREARQSLRGSFGWPTFQEGLVEGVYFRFDPDGYARFSPSPRLDTDVFEVVCRPRTYSCMGRKDTMSVVLTNRGQLQVKIEGVAAGDRFFATDGISEIQLPDRILQPLDVQLETLLSTGGEMQVRRGSEEISNISLKGFSAVAGYLRWVLSRQDYSVLPRGWPVPNSKVDTGDMTRPATWDSPMPQPQVLAPNVYGGAGNAGGEFGNDVAGMRQEIQMLRQLLEERSATEGNAPQPPVAPMTTVVQAGTDPMLGSRLTELQTIAEDIRREIETLQGAPAGNLVMQPQPDIGSPPYGAQMGQSGPYDQPAPYDMTMGQPAYPAAPVAAAVPEEQTNSASYAERLAYLIVEVGLQPEAAVAVLRTAETPQPVGEPAEETERPGVYQGDVVEDILRELETDLSVSATTPVAPVAPTVDPQEYQLLSEYFTSVVLPQLSDN